LLCFLCAYLCALCASGPTCKTLGKTRRPARLLAVGLRLRVPIVVWKSRATMGCEGPNGALAKLRGADLFVLSHLVEFCKWLWSSNALTARSESPSCSRRPRLP